MTSKFIIEDRVIERTMAKYPEISELVEFSTPVVSFGYPHKARVATLGINPSSNEFQIGNGNKTPLGQEIPKRLVDTEILEIEKPRSLTREEAVAVINGCYEYFHGPKANPYDWFSKLQKYILDPAGFSYFGEDATACHLDLVQWATDPVWDSMRNKESKSLLLEEDKEFLRFQLTNYNFEFVFLNGSTVINQFKKLGLADLEEVHSLTATSNGGRHSVVRGEAGGTTYLGWGINAGAKYANKQGLNELVEFLNLTFSRNQGEHRKNNIPNTFS